MSLPVLAVVSPLPPAPSGVADYTDRLLPHLTEHWDVVVVSAQHDPGPPTPSVDVPVVTMAEWEWTRKALGVDRMLLCLGNSVFHVHVPELARRHGGVVLAHDVRMTALHCLRASVSPERHFLSGIVERRHGPELAREVRELEARGHVSEVFSEVRALLERANALLLGEAVEGADRLCVHSELAARLARLELHGHPIPVTVVPFGHPPVRRVPGQRVGASIASFGMVAPEKSPVLLVEALAVVRQHIPGATLTFVGPVGGDMDRALTEAARRLGVEDAVTFLDRVDRTRYERELAEATVGVQLRSVVNGEMSAAVADCLSAGLPTVVSAVGGHAQVPSTAVRPLSPDAAAHEVAEEITALLVDVEARAKLARGAVAHAERCSFELVASTLTQVLLEAPPLRD